MSKGQRLGGGLSDIEPLSFRDADRVNTMANICTAPKVYAAPTVTSLSPNENSRAISTYKKIHDVTSPLGTIYLVGKSETTTLLQISCHLGLLL